MGMKELQQLNDQTAWTKFMEKAYQTVQTEHSKSKLSWVKTRFAPGSKKDSIVNLAGQTTAWGGTGASAAAVAGASAVAAAHTGAVAVGAAGLGVGLLGAGVVAVPAVLALGTLAYWGYNKKEHHMVNEEIWKYFNEHRDKNHTFKVDTKDPEFKDVKKWFGWFGDEGISNMDRLQDKLREAQTKLHGNLISLDLKRKALFNDITLWATPRASTPQAKEQQKQNLMKRADGLADEYMKLAQDLWYVWYRLARTFMYFEMLQLTVKGLLKGMEGELARLENEAAGFFENDVEAYERLRHQLNSFPLFLK